MAETSAEHSGLTRVYLGGVTLLLALTLSVRASAGLPCSVALRPLMSQVVAGLMTNASLSAPRREVESASTPSPFRPHSRTSAAQPTCSEGLTHVCAHLVRVELLDLPPPVVG